MARRKQPCYYPVMENKRIIEKLISCNSGHDVAAILRDGSIQPCTDHFNAGITVREGLDWDELNARYPEAAARTKAEREQRQKIM